MAITALLELGAAANAERERRHGGAVFFSRDGVAVYGLECTAAELAAALAAVPAGTHAVAVRIRPEAGATAGEAEIRAIAQARLALPAVAHIAADWQALTPYVAQVALRFGADTLCNIPAGTPRAEVLRLIEEAGREARECNAAFEPGEFTWDSPLPVLHS